MRSVLILTLSLSFAISQNNALSLVGYESSYATFPNTSEIISEDFTISLWFKSDGLNNSSTFDMILDMSNNEYLEFYLNGTNCQACDPGTFVGFIKKKSNETTKNYTKNSTLRVDDNKWHNAVMVRHSSTGNVDTYIDGQLYDQSSAGSGPLRLNNIVIGKRNADGNRTFKGMVDELAVWNKTLSSNEIKEIYQLLKLTHGEFNVSGYTSSDSLVGYWKMDRGNDGINKTLYDLSGNGNDGIISNPSFWLETPFPSALLTTDTIYVSNEVNNEVIDGSLMYPFKTIEAAFLVAKANFTFSDKPRYLEFDVDGKKTFKGDTSFIEVYPKYAVSIPIIVMDGVYEIEQEIDLFSQYHLNDIKHSGAHVLTIQSLNGPEKTIIKPAFKTIDPGGNKSEEGFRANTNGYLELHGFTLDSLEFGINNGSITVYNSLLKQVYAHVPSGSNPWPYRYAGSTLINHTLFPKNHMHNSIIIGWHDPLLGYSGDGMRVSHSIIGAGSYGGTKVYSKGSPRLDAWAYKNLYVSNDPTDPEYANNPQFCDDSYYKYYDTSPAVGLGSNGVNVGVGGVGCDKPKPFDWITVKNSSINIDQGNLDNQFTLGWSESKDIYGDLRYQLFAKVGMNPFELVDDSIQESSYAISYQEFLENAFNNAPGSSATVRFKVYASDGQDTIRVSGDDRFVSVNRYDYLSIQNNTIPDEFALHKNYPNPFNPTTQIRFDLPEVSNVTLTIYNLIGQKIRTFNMQSAPAGHHSLIWNATNDLGASVSAGVYLYQLQTKGFAKTKKMILLK